MGKGQRGTNSMVVKENQALDLVPAPPLASLRALSNHFPPGAAAPLVLELYDLCSSD